MTRVVRTETRQRGFVGKCCKWAFIAFNLLMLAISLVTCSSASKVMATAHSDAEQAGSAIGATIATGMVLTLWVAGVVILGALTLFTRGKKVVIEEVVE